MGPLDQFSAFAVARRRGRLERSGAGPVEFPASGTDGGSFIGPSRGRNAGDRSYAIRALIATARASRFRRS